MNIYFLSSTLFVISLITNLTVEAIKHVAIRHGHKISSNAMAAVTSVAISLLVSVAYIITNHVEFTATIGITMITLAYLSFIVANRGYDKVIQMVKQISSIDKHDRGDER